MSHSSCIVCALFSDSCHRVGIHGRIELRLIFLLPWCPFLGVRVKGVGRLPARACPPSLGGVAAGRVSGERLPSVARPPTPARRHCLSPPGRARAGRRLTCALGARPPTALRAAGGFAGIRSVWRHKGAKPAHPPYRAGFIHLKKKAIITIISGDNC